MRFLVVPVAASILLGPAQAVAQTQPEPTLSIKDAHAFVTQLQAMGLKPEPDLGGTLPNIKIQSNGSADLVVLGGCEKLKNCKYIVILSSFTDLVNPPAEWVAAANAKYDLIKVWVSDEKLLTYSMGLMAEGMPISVFRAHLDMYDSSGSDLASEAVKDKLPQSKK